MNDVLMSNYFVIMMNLDLIIFHCQVYRRERVRTNNSFEYCFDSRQQLCVLFSHRGFVTLVNAQTHASFILFDKIVMPANRENARFIIQSICGMFTIFYTIRFARDECAKCFVAQNSCRRYR